tara:strand:+ start:361 stop:744 length:384 start_codon:yes stop_codon:yes gene_type:complete
MAIEVNKKDERFQPIDKQRRSNGHGKRDAHGRFTEGRWKQGQSGNPKGRTPKHECFTSLLKEEIEKIHPEDKEGRTWAQLIVIGTMQLALDGNATALKELWDRVDGKVPLRMNEEQGPLEIIVTYDR